MTDVADPLITVACTINMHRYCDGTALDYDQVPVQIVPCICTCHKRKEVNHLTGTTQANEVNIRFTASGQDRNQILKEVAQYMKSSSQPSGFNLQAIELNGEDVSSELSNISH